MSQDWDIKPRGGECGACRGTFDEGELYYTRLVFGTGGYERADFCAPCWEAQVKAQPRYSAWHGEFHVPPAEPVRKVKKETAESLLRELIAHNDPARVNAIYILGVMLERQRVLVERELRQADDGGKLIVYEHRKTGETFVVRDPQLKLTEIETVQSEIMQLLAGVEGGAHGAEPPAPEAMASADAATSSAAPGAMP